MPYRILVVCTGNICRSPMGEIVLREKISRLPEAENRKDGNFAARTPARPTVSSAGVSDEEHGHYLDPRAAQILRENGYPLPREHRAHLATREELSRADLILPMTLGQARALRPMLKAAGADPAKVHLWREFDGTAPLFPRGVYAPGAPLGEDNGAPGSRQENFYTSDGRFDVPDPWYGSVDGFRKTLKTVENGAAGIIDYLYR